MRFQLAISASVAALGLFSTSAFADESWTHFYAGVYSDYSSVNTQLSPTNGYVFAVNGLSGGVMLGYDKQFGSFVLGAEGDFGYSGVNGGGGDGSWVINMSGLDLAARLRAGYAFDNLLLYGTGGVTSAPWVESYNGGTSLLNERETGWQVGGGLEYAISRDVNIRGEYIYTNYGLSSGLSIAPNIQMQTNSSTFRLGLSYKF